MVKNDFKASNGWLESFKKRHNIACAVACGESASVSSTTVDDWKSRLPALYQGYAAKDIFNMDETGVFYRALPDRTLNVKGSDCHGGKKSKERLTVVLCCSLTGEMLTPLVIGKSANPRCFRNLSKDALPVTWKSNKKAWMTSALFTEWLQSLNQSMRLQRRHILLYLDNAPSHPQNASMSNVKVVFFPPNTTSKLQPLDQGIIQNFKVLYRKSLLRHVLCQLSGDSPVSTADISKSVNVLHACQWVSTAAKQVKAQTISNCFYHAGFPKSLSDTNEREQSEAASESQPLSEDEELRDLIASASLSLSLPEPLTAEAYLSVDDDIPASEELSETWEADLLQESRRQASAGSGSSDEVEEDDPEPTQAPLEIGTYAQALHYAQQLKLFALEKDSGDLFSQMTAVSTVLEKKILKQQLQLKQVTIDQFLI